MKIQAAVARAPGQPFSIEPCELAEPGPAEVLVVVVACGICHTDLAVRDQHMPTPLPAVLGHEGVGIVRALGPGVSEFAEGDRVLMGFGACGVCGHCRQPAPAYCDQAHVYQLLGSRADGSSPLSQNGRRLTGHFFAQSSFATHAVAATHNMVKLDDDLPPALMAPLACGVQTGMASVLVALNAQPGDSIAIFGCGTVGLAAIVAAKIAGCDTIVAVDLKDSRLALARELGATHTINGAQTSATKQILALGGVNHAFDNTGVPAVARGAFDALKKRGTLLCVGVGEPGAALSLDMATLMASGRSVRGAAVGDAVPRQFVPRMIDYYRRGQLPLEKLVTTFAFSEINEAVAAMESGEVVKPVLVMG